MATIRGTNGDDTIDEVNNGGSLTGSDEIFAMGGNDRIFLERNDPSAGAITDKVHGGDGTDTLFMDIYSPGTFNVGTGSAAAGYTGSYSETPNNTYTVQFDGIEQFDLTLHAAGTLTTGDGADFISDYVGGATVNTAGGNDVVLANTGGATIDTGAGRDKLELDFSGGGRTVHTTTALSGSLATGYSGAITSDYNGVFTFANVEDFSIYGNNDSDEITTGDGDDSVLAAGGNDTISVAKGANYVDGGDGNDQLSIDLSGQTTGSTIDLRIVNAAQASGGTNRITNVESFGTVVGSNFADTLIEGNGVAADGTISGGGGNDTIQVSTGTDTIDGGAGTDTLVLDYSQVGRTVHIDQALGGTLAGGYSGTYVSDNAATTKFSGIENFKIYANNDSDTIVTGDGDDTVSGGAGNDTLTVGKGANTVDGGADNDQLSIDLSGQTVGSTIDLTKAGQQASGGTNSVTNVEAFVGTVTGSSRGDTLIEGAAYQTNATFNMGAGNDTVQVSLGNDTVNGEGGTDTLVLDYSKAGRTVHIDQALTGSLTDGYSGTYVSDNAASTTFSGIENFKVYGNNDSDTIITGDGDDIVSGGAGNDTLTVGKGTNIVDGGADNDQLSIDLSGQTVGSTIDLTKTGQQASGGTNSVTNVEAFGGTVTGSSSGDTLIEGAAYQTNATFNMGAGNDTVQVSIGNDTVNGGAGTDTLVLDYSQVGRTVHIDQALGGSLSDGYSGTYTSDNAATTTFSGIEKFRVYANNDSDTIITGDGDDTVSGAGGDDTLTVGAGTNLVDGGDGNDRLGIDLSGQAAASTIDLTKAGQQASGGTNSVTNVEAFGGTVTGSSHGDTLIEGNAVTYNATFNMGIGDDTVQVSTGNDTVNGGAGTDTLVLDYSATGRTVHIDQALGGSLADGYSGTYTSDNAATTTFTGIEKFRVYGNNDGDTIITGDGDDTVSSAGGDDTLTVGKGANTVDGGTGNDRLSIDLSGQAAASTIDLTKAGQQASGGTNSVTNVEEFTGTVTGSSHGDTLIEGTAFSADTTFAMGSGNDTVQVSLGNDTVNGGAGTDTLVLDYSQTGRTVHAGTALSGSVTDGYSGSFVSDNGATTTFSGIENFRIYANADGDTIVTGDGADIVSGSGGNDTISTAGGNDLVLGGSGDDTLDGGDGIDTVSYADAGSGVTVNLAVTTQQGTGGGGSDTIANFENVTGSAFADTLTGTDGANVIDGGAGADAMTGGGGNDTYYVDDTGDTISDASGSDTVFSAISYTLAANLENLYAADPAATTAISLTGNGSANTIGGNAGNNTLTGGGGIDTVTYAFATRGVTVDLSTTAAQNTVGAGSDTIGGFENLTGSAFNDTLSGNGANNVLDGGAGIDTVSYADAAANVTVSLATTAAQATGDGTDTLLRFENLTGSAHDDTLTGSTAANTISGGAGNDTIDGGLGDDTLDGGAGTDTVSYRSATAGVTVDLSAPSGRTSGGGGTDTITGFENVTGSAYADTLKGDAGANVLDGGAGADTLTGGAGDDTYYVDDAGDRVIEAAGTAGGTDRVVTTVSYGLAAGQAIETLSAADPTATTAINLAGNEFAQGIRGNAGANTLNGKGGADLLYGFGGNDTYFVDDAGDRVFEAVGGGTDRVLASVDYTLAAGQEIETLATTSSSGTAAIDLAGNEFAQTVQGNAGANVLNGGGGADTLYGYGGDDTYIVDNAGDRVIEAAGQGNDRVVASVDYRLGAGQSIERLSAAGGATGTAAIDLTGNALAQTIEGTAAANVLTGGGGGDMLYGFAGDDTYFVSSASDLVFEAAGGGNDRVATSVSYTLAAGQEIERLQTTSAAGTAAINLTGNGFANLIQGNAGANTIDGGAGADTLYGYGGDDTYFVDNAGDRVVEAAGGGNDRVIASVSYALTAGQEIERLQTSSSGATTAIDLTGNAFAQAILGNAGANVLNGGGGADTMTGLGGDDTYFVDDAADRVIEAAGGGNDRVATSVSYALEAGQEIERLQTTSVAGTGAIALTGNEIANLIQGNAGANTIDGGGGADTLYGYGGADTFAFTTTLGSGNVDKIADFANSTNAVHDRISLSRAIFSGLAAGSTLSAGAFKDITSGGALDADDRILYNHNTGALSYDSDGSGSAAAVQFATISNKVALTNLDFVIAG